MEKTTIGYNAGAIWDKLRETGRITIAELARKLNMAADETMASLFVLWSRSRLSSSMSIRRFGLLSSLTSHRNRRGCKTNCVSKAIKY